MKWVKLKQQQQNEEFEPLNSDVSAEFNGYHIECTELTTLLQRSRICSNWIPRASTSSSARKEVGKVWQCD